MAEGVAKQGPTAEGRRIDSLDVLRGVALLGILLLNILGFGLLSSGYFDPQVGMGDSQSAQAVNLAVWAIVDLLFEGSMRGLFTLLFGAGVLLFLANGRDPKWHFRRNTYLLLFGLFNAFVLLWTGDILVTYAIASLLLYPLRNHTAKQLLSASAALLVLLSVVFALSNVGMGQLRQAADQVAMQSQAGEPVAAGTQQLADEWHAFVDDMRMDETLATAELAQRRASYPSAFSWTAAENVELLLFAIPMFLLWDALLMMLLGMALYRWNVLDASRSRAFYLKLTAGSFAVGLSVNGFEVWQAWHSGFDILYQFSYFQPTYHLGRMAMSLGYVGLVMLWCQPAVASTWLANLRMRLAAVGRMALTNYLMHSVICLLVFTGAGLAQVGHWQRWQLYLFVLAIWLLQLWFSPWWLRRYRYGPMEWLWRSLTYGQRQPLRRTSH